MSTIKVDTIATRTGSGNITLSNNVASLTSAGAISGTNITASGTLAVTGDATFDTSVLKVDAANNRVGIGTASPSSDLHVSGGAGAHVAIQSSAGSHWRLGDAVGSSNGIFVVRDHTNSANRIQILANGKTQIAQGITFGSDTADVNTLDDYEEGTFSPTLEHQGNSNLSTTKTANNIGSYVKMGTTVQFQMVISINAVSGGDSSNLQVGNMPFTAKAIATNGYGGATVTYTAWNSTDPIAAIVLSASDDMRLYTGALQPALGNQLSNQTYIVLHGQYETAS